MSTASMVIESVDDSSDDITDVEAMKRRVKEMEEEAAKIEATIAADPSSTTLPAGAASDASGKDAGAASGSNAASVVVNGPDSDLRSVYVGNVDYGTTPEELQTFFQSCGVVNRITIVCDKMTGHPKGYAYVEFVDQESVANAMLLNDSEFRSRVLKISPKRTNVPGFARGQRRFGGRRRGAGRFPGGYGRFRGRGRRAPHPYHG
ncbi:RRM domain-containing protein [Plasmodiophora brassicae]|uniref:RRM domain-containing protein n=1 Tax=Plasmodiophora brassicae TaxID=37360 RepID=A0A0G4IXZ7_PLABS|nr:hypothetical protein PBRA_007914 [Plasmodiophora brassicae]